jgi:hypothetical protein
VVVKNVSESFLFGDRPESGSLWFCVHCRLELTCMQMNWSKSSENCLLLGGLRFEESSSRFFTVHDGVDCPLDSSSDIMYGGKKSFGVELAWLLGLYE